MSPKTTPSAPSVSAAMPALRVPAAAAARGRRGVVRAGGSTGSPGVSDAGSTSVIRSRSPSYPHHVGSGRPVGGERGRRRMATTAALTAEVEPEEVGLDPERLARLDAYLDGFVDAAGASTGSLLVITRGGRIAHVSQRGQRDARGRPAGRARHDLAHLLDDQADHLGRGDDALRGGRALAQGPGGEVHPVVRRPARVPPAGWRRRPSRPARPSRCACGTCSPTPPG